MDRRVRVYLVTRKRANQNRPPSHRQPGALVHAMRLWAPQQPTKSMGHSDESQHSPFAHSPLRPRLRAYFHHHQRWSSTGAGDWNGGGDAETGYRECAVLVVLLAIRVVVRACGKGPGPARGEYGRCVIGARAHRSGSCRCLRRRLARGRAGRTLWIRRSSRALGRASREEGLA